MTVKYTLTDFQKINAEGFDVVLPTDVIDQINDLVKHVGSPNYIRTPIFHKPPKPIGSKRRHREQKQTINTQELWDKMTKHTVVSNDEESDKSELSIQSIRSYLNKLTDKNIDDISLKLCDIVDKTTEMNDVELIKSFANAIFEIASSNKFFSAVYADLYSILYTRYEIMQTLLEERYEMFFNNFDDIRYVSPDENYDAFCDINKENDRRRSMSTFYLNLYCNGVFPIEKIEKLLVHIMNKLLSSIQLENKTAEVEEYTENIAILYNHDMEYNDKLKLSNRMNIQQVVPFIAKTKNKTYPSLSSKCIFKFMDICEM